MGQVTVGTEPVQIAWYNPKRKKLIIQFLPASIFSGNTGLVFLKRGSAPVASLTSNSWDAVLNSGSTDGENIDEANPKADYIGDVWLVSDTAGQIVNVSEYNTAEPLQSPA